MNRWICRLGALLLLCFAQRAVALEPCPASCLDPVGGVLQCTRCAAIPCRCADEYCRKPFPCVPCPLLGTGGCYAPKPLPCIPCGPMSWCSDDYCRKPFPQFCWPLDRESYRCPPSGCRTAAAVDR